MDFKIDVEKGTRYTKSGHDWIYTYYYIEETSTEIEVMVDVETGDLQQIWPDPSCFDKMSEQLQEQGFKRA